jgi:drug/metabolite transporter (DMT)-like permease
MTYRGTGHAPGDRAEPPCQAAGMESTRRGATQAISRVDFGLLLFLGAVWGGAYLFLRIAAPQVGPLWAAEARVGLAALILVAVAGRRTWSVARGRLLSFLVVGAAFSAIPFSLIAFASLTLPAGFGALLNASTPIFTALVSAAWIGDRLTVRVVSGMVVGVLAVFVLVGWSPLPFGPATLTAVAAALAASLSYAFAGTFVRRRLTGVTGIELATGQLVTGALLILPFAALSGPPGFVKVDGIVALVGIAVLSTALAWPIFFRVLSHTTPTAASTVTFIVPAFGIAWGALILAEPVGPELIVGFGLVMISLVLVLRLPLPGGVRLAARLAGLAGRRTVPAAPPA